MKKRSLTTLTWLAIALPCLTHGQRQMLPPPFTAVPYAKGGIYAVGARVGWTLTLPADSTSPRRYAYTIKKNNFELIKSGEVDLSSGSATIETSLDAPGMVYLVATPENGGRPVALGAAVEPRKLKPVVDRPRDFDAFWKAKIKELEAIPMNAVLAPADSGRQDVDFAILKMDHVNGHHVYGQIARPKTQGKHPAILLLQWASPPYPLQKSWVTGLASQGWIALDIEPHDVLPDQPQSYYDALPRDLKNYTAIGQNDRDKSYFVQMYLADYRAVDYLVHDPDWDGKTLVVMGTSMGGQQSLCVAGLHPRITHLIANEPSGCDLNGPLHGRQGGYPNFPPNDPLAMETARYVDAVNFAPRIHATSLVAMGFVDTVATPAGIWTAFNLIRGRKEAAPMFDSPHNNTATPAQQRPFTSRSTEWLSALARGENVRPNADAGKP